MQKIRLSDVALAAGVTAVTASKVLNPSKGNNTRTSKETRTRILEAAERLGYHVNVAASQLAGGRNRTVGVLIDSGASHMEFARVSYSEQAVAKMGYRLMVGQCQPDIKNIQRYIDDFVGRGIEGVMIHSNSFPSLNAEIVKLAGNIRHVLYYDRPITDNGACDFVDIDLASGVRQSVEHLYRKGRRKIVYFAPYNHFTYGKYPSYYAREQGFADGMRQFGLPFDPQFMNRYIFQKPFSTEMLTGELKRMILQEKPDAIITRNDHIAMIVLRTFQLLKIKCPDEIALIGYDNSYFADALYPALTTVDNGLLQVSEEAARILIGRMENTIDPEPHRKIFTPELVVRESA